MRTLLLATTIVCGWMSGANASVVYNLTLTDTTDPTFSGSGSITLNAAPAATGLTNYAAGQYSNLNFTVGGQTFTSPPGGVSAVQFLNGSFFDITFAQQTGSSPNRYALQTTVSYTFYYNDLSKVAFGAITSAPATAPTDVPEPATLVLLATGIVGLAAGRKRRS